MRYRARILPAIGKPLKTGDLGNVLSTTTQFLDSHPAYSVAIQRAEGPCHHSVRLGTQPAGFTVHGQAVDNAPLTVLAMLETDVAEIRNVLTNLQLPIHEQEPST